MAVEVEIDVEVLKSEIKKTYASVSEEPEKDFIFPTGRAWAEDLGYPEELANVPEAAVESFAGVANPFSLGRLAPGERVLDLGSGAGTDSLVAAQMVGADGRVTGIDMTPEMLAKASAAAAELGATHVEFVEAEAERLPFADKSFDAEARVLAPLREAGKVAVIPPRRNRKEQRAYDTDLYEARHLIENFFCKVKQFRAIATRYDKTARNFLAAVHLVATVILLN